MKVKLIVDGGGMSPGPAVAQQLGPMGINLGKVISDVNQATSGFKGMKVPVELDVDPKTKKYKISVSSPPMSELIKKELKAEKGSGEPHRVKVGNIAIETLIEIAKTKMPNLLAKDLKASLKLAVGSCVSLGVLIDNKEAKEIQSEINAGNYDEQISKEITTPSSEKVKSLQAHFKTVLEKQDKEKKAEEEAAKTAEEAKTKKAEGTEVEKAKAEKESEAEKSEAPEEKKK